MYKAYCKRILDIGLSFLMLIILCPIIVFAALLLAISNKGTPFFFQNRPGYNGKIFRLIKFKTMTDERSVNGELLPDTDRLSSFGKKIRQFSIDELPQLINVLRGDMSLIGPRPLLVEYLPLYSEKQKRRHCVKPGITGWAQVNGRNAISWEQKFDYDVWYVDNQSFGLDCKILYLTIIKVFRSEGISSTTSVTMEKFEGNKIC